MSHIVTIQTEVRDPTAVHAACERLTTSRRRGTERLDCSRPKRRDCSSNCRAGVIRSFARPRSERSPTTTTAARGASRLISIDSCKPTRSKRRAWKRASKAMTSSNRRSPTVRSSSPSQSEVRMKTSSKIIIALADGSTRVETHGFPAQACREASRFLEQALGQVRSPNDRPPSSIKRLESTSPRPTPHDLIRLGGHNHAMPDLALVLNVHGGVVQDVFASDPRRRDHARRLGRRPGRRRSSGRRRRSPIVSAARVTPTSRRSPCNPARELVGTDVDAAIEAAEFAALLTV